MPWLPLVLLAAFGIAARFVFARLAGCLLWIILAVVGVTLLLAVAPRPGHAQEAPLRVVWAEPLAPELNLPVATSARGLVLSASRELPARPRARAARVLLAGDPQGKTPIWADDLLRVRWVDASGREATLEHDFRRADREAIEPWGPVDVTGLLPDGPVIALFEVVDLAPPKAGLGPLWLVGLAPETTPGPTSTPSPLPTSSPPPTATPLGTVVQPTPTASPSSAPTATPTPSPPVAPQGSAGEPQREVLIGGVAVTGLVAAGLGVVLRSSVRAWLERLT